MNAQIREEAADWLVQFRLEEPNAAERDRFAQWLRASPAHVEAFLQLTVIWEDAQSLDAAREIDVSALVQLARSDDSVVPLAARVTARAEPALGASIGREPVLFKRVAAAGVLGLCLLAGWLAWPAQSSYSTDVGEQRVVKLPDGSVAELNALSEMRVRFSKNVRRVELTRGQALFKVAKNKERPFIVASGETQVRAVGTEFDVRHKMTGTIVTVVEGRVAVSASNGLDPQSLPVTPIEVSAGEQLDVTAAATPRKSTANIAISTAWTQQQLIFESTPLSEVAEEFNRFNTQKLVVQGEPTRALHISGNFPALDPTSLPRFIRFLRAQPGVLVTESDDQVIVTQK